MKHTTTQEATMSQTMTYSTATEQAATIRQTLKREHGWNSRQVSVRAEQHSTDSAINVTIKDASIPLAAVEAIANQAQHIDRCHLSGEILSGGNMYVHVEYSDAATRTFVDRYMGHTLAAVLEADECDGHVPVLGTPYRIAKRQSYGYAIWGPDGHVCDVWDARGAAEMIGQHMIKHGGR